MGKEDEREKCQIQTIGKAEESWRSDWKGTKDM
jgi:hypothetical protein